MFVVEDVFPILKHVLTPKLYTALQVVGIFDFTAMSLKAQLTALAVIFIWLSSVSRDVPINLLATSLIEILKIWIPRQLLSNLS